MHTENRKKSKMIENFWGSIKCDGDRFVRWEEIKIFQQTLISLDESYILNIKIQLSKKQMDLIMFSPVEVSFLEEGTQSFRLIGIILSVRRGYWLQLGVWTFNENIAFCLNSWLKLRKRYPGIRDNKNGLFEQYGCHFEAGWIYKSCSDVGVSDVIFAGCNPCQKFD